MAEAIPYEEIAGYLRILGAPGRLELLRQLQVPRALGEIALPASRADRERAPGRQVTRATVAAHLKRLEEAGLVRARSAERGGSTITEYETDAARLFVMLDELRRVGLLRPRAGGDTVVEDVPEVAPPDPPQTRSFLVVNGPLEGRAIALDGPGPWTIGRDARAEIRIPHDPFVSRQNTRLSLARGRVVAEPLPDAQNGTLVNWRALRGPQPLSPGDVVGVGRSLLVFHGGPA